MKKSILNIIIDATSLVVFMVMISTGLLLNYILPPGSGRIEMITSGGGRREKTIDLFMGLARHEWGEIHFTIALIFLVLLITHLVLHWKWIISVAFGTKAQPQPLRRKIIAIGIILFIIFALLFPWIGNKETYTRSEILEIRELSSPK